jgi:hypothetical protein
LNLRKGGENKKVKFFHKTPGFYTKGDFDITYLGNKFRDKDKEMKFAYGAGGATGLICVIINVFIFFFQYYV